MKWPVMMRRGEQLILQEQTHFQMIGRLDARANTLESNVLASGTADLRWVLDAEGQFYSLTSTGLLPATLMQTLRLSRRIERYQIGQAQTLRVAELTALVAVLADPFPEAPNATDLREALSTLDSQATWGAKEMRSYLGVEAAD